jgi:hypothetical protein
MLVLPSLAAAGEDTEQESVGSFLQQDDLKTYQRLEECTARFAAAGFEDFPMSSDVFNVDYRSPGRAFFYSLMVPAAGQLYTGSKVKAAVFFGIEAIAWVAYFSYHSDGKDQEDSYQVFADDKWDPQQYRNWLVDTYGISSDTFPYPDANGELQTFSHHLPETRTQQYYEMIGKYEQFRYGWADTDYLASDSVSAFREQYLIDRDNANSAFGKAKAAAIVSIANHLLSAFDAALAAKRYNRKQDAFTELMLKTRLAKYYDEQIPEVTLTYRFF